MSTTSKITTRIATAVLATAAALAFAAPAQAASAAPACVVQINLPAKIAIDRAALDTTVTVSGCPGFKSVGALLSGARWTHSFIGFNATRTDVITTFSSTDPGVYRTVSGSVWDQNWNKGTFRPTATTIKYASRASLSMRRSGSSSVFTILHDSYVPYWGFIRRSAVGVVQQAKAGNAGPWTTIGSRLTNANGSASFTRPTSPSMVYRVVFNDNSTTFGSATTAVRS